MEYVEVQGAGGLKLRAGHQPTPRPGEVLIEVAFCGLCRSDVGAIAGFRGDMPQRLGHEVAGRVVAANGVGTLPVGTPVVALVDDGYATAVAAPAERVVTIPAGVPLLDAALAEPVACMVMALDRLRLAARDPVALVGGGFMGLLLLQLLVKRGHSVTVFDPRTKARGLADVLGAAALPPERGMGMEMAGAFPLVVECAGNEAALALASHLVGIGGQLGIVGYHQSDGGVRRVDMRGWNYKGIDVINAHERSPAKTIAAMRAALGLMANQTIQPARLVTETIALRDLPRWFADGTGRGYDGIKAVVRCGTG